MSGEGEDILLEEEESWFSGNNPPGVLFSLNEAVEINEVGRGAVVSLLRIRPVPKYLVELGDGKEIEVFQDAISRIST